MQIVLLFVPILMWSFVGTLVQGATGALSPFWVSFFRFSFGVVALGGWFLLRRRKPALRFADRWVWIAAAAKSINYVAENVAIMRGYSWGYIVEYPVQAVVLLAVSALVFKERLTGRKLFAALLCVSGAYAVGGISFRSLQAGGLGVFLLFSLSACGSAMHLVTQKILIRRMDSGDLNLSVFLLASVFTAIPLPFTGSPLVAPLTFGAMGSAVALGCITGLSFLIWGSLLARIPLLFAGLFANLSVVFVLVWGALLNREPVGPWALGGTALFLAGLVLIGLPERKR